MSYKGFVSRLNYLKVVCRNLPQICHDPTISKFLRTVLLKSIQQWGMQNLPTGEILIGLPITQGTAIEIITTQMMEL